MPFILIAILAAGQLPGPRRVASSGPTSHPTSRPTSRPTSLPAASQLQTRVESLARQLGHADFRKRRDAQRRLAGLGEAAVPYLVPFISDSDPEIAGRTAALMKTPADPNLRVELAVRLLATSHPDWMERAVHMLFAEPTATHDPFMARGRKATPLEKAIYAPIEEQFREWKRMDAVVRAHCERIREKNPAGAEKQMRLHRESNMYRAEAAYWGALEAMYDHLDGNAGKDSSASRTASRPTTRSASP